MRFRAEPQGGMRLAADIVRAGEEGVNALRLAVLGGSTGEDWSRGYSLADDPAVRAVQERFRAIPARDLPELRRIEAAMLTARLQSTRRIMAPPS